MNPLIKAQRSFRRLKNVRVYTFEDILKKRQKRINQRLLRSKNLKRKKRDKGNQKAVVHILVS